MTRSMIYSGTKKERNNQAAKKYQKTVKGKAALKRYQTSEKAKIHCEKLKTDKKRLTYSRAYHLKQTYGLTLEQYDEMLEQQDSVCAICGETNLDGKRLYVDHNHETGKVRGLLCLKCNNRLGVLENKDWRSLAEEYLQY